MDSQIIYFDWANWPSSLYLLPISSSNLSSNLKMCTFSCCWCWCWPILCSSGLTAFIISISLIFTSSSLWNRLFCGFLSIMLYATKCPVPAWTLSSHVYARFCSHILSVLWKLRLRNILSWPTLMGTSRSRTDRNLYIFSLTYCLERDLLNK